MLTRGTSSRYPHTDCSHVMLAAIGMALTYILVVAADR